jgi:hypothetical protein
MKSPLYLMENLRGGQVPLVLLRWPVDIMSKKEKEKLAKQHLT